MTAFTDEERSAIKDRAKELKAARRGGADGEQEVLDKIAELPDADRLIAERLHEIIKTAAPALVPRLWYGMPAYAKNGKVLCFFQGTPKFTSRYATLGFNDVATLDDGPMWPTAFALTELTADVEARLHDLIGKAAA